MTHTSPDRDSVSSVARTESYLEAIERGNPKVNAVLTVTAEMARKQAAAADTATIAGEWLGLLHGEPVLIKDCFNIEGVRTTYGSILYERNIADHDSVVITRLRRAGAVFLGKANLSEYCYGATTENVHFGNCRNPWNADHVPGGSSGGTAAGVAARFCRIGLGSDTGGSVRVPAAFCGVVGLRPTVGRIPNTRSLGASTIMDTIGPMACTVADVARTYVQIAGYDMNDPLSENRPVSDLLPALSDGVCGLRIGLPRQIFFEDLSDEVEVLVRAAAAELEAAGATLVDLDIEDVAALKDRSAFNFVLADMADQYRDVMVEKANSIGSEVLRRMRLGLDVSGVDYAASIRKLQRWKLEFRRLFAQVDLLLTPTTPTTAPSIADTKDMVAATRDVTRYTYEVGGAGVPAISIPVGFDSQGLPAAMQLIAPWFDERGLFRAAAAYQARTEFHRAAPSLA